MKRNWLMVIAVILALVLLGLIVKNKLFGKPEAGAISVSVNPKSSVFIDNVRVGTTPYTNEKIISGEHLVKVIPEDTVAGLALWEGKVNVMPNVLTIVNRSLGQTESVSSGEVFWLEKISSKDKAELAVVSVPDQAVVKIDGKPEGFAPVSIEDLNPGTYQVVVASPGYEERTIPSAKAVAGYKLIINVQLAKKLEGIQEATESGEQAIVTPKATPSPKVTPRPSVTPPEKPYVKIKETPTGWLRVRMAPSASATEAAKVNPNEMFPYLGEQENGWLKIEYEKDKEGWVSGSYVELVK